MSDHLQDRVDFLEHELARLKTILLEGVEKVAYERDRYRALNRRLVEALSKFTDGGRGHRVSTGDGCCLEHGIVGVPAELPCPVLAAQELVEEAKETPKKPPPTPMPSSGVGF